MMIPKNQNMIVEADILCEAAISVQLNLCVPKSDAVPIEEDSCAPDAVSISLSPSESGINCSVNFKTTPVESPAKKIAPTVRSGSHTDVGPRKSNEDEHIRIDDLATHLGSCYRWPIPSSFYAVFDGHGGSEAATYVKNNATRLFFEDLPLHYDAGKAFLEEVEDSQCDAFLMADQALAEDCSVSDYCGTTALTALVLGGQLFVANAGDCRAVLCRNGNAVQLSEDHRPSSLAERKRVEDLGGFFDDGYLNGELAVTRALGDWYMKLPSGPKGSPLIARPDIRRISLTEDDEFLIMGCDGIWDVMSNQEAVCLVRRGLRRHDDPEKSAKELVNLALRLDTSDNATAVVVSFSSAYNNKGRGGVVRGRGSRFRFCSMSEDARNRLWSFLEG